MRHCVWDKNIWLFVEFQRLVANSWMRITWAMRCAVRVRSAGQKYGPTCHQRNRADVTEFVILVRLSSLGQHVDVLALAGYKRRKSALAAGPIAQVMVLTCWWCQTGWVCGQVPHAHVEYDAITVCALTVVKGWCLNPDVYLPIRGTSLGDRLLY